MNTIPEARGPNVVFTAPVGSSTRLPKPNSKCICNSGKKAKHCCLKQYNMRRAAALAEARNTPPEAGDDTRVREGSVS